MNNQMPEAATAPAPIQVNQESAAIASIDSLLSSRRQRHYFGSIARHYSSLLLDVESDLRQIVEAGSAVLYLIDADVVRNLVESPFHDTRLKREAKKLFSSPTFEYAIPLGAFQEILRWLRSFSQFTIPWTDFNWTGGLMSPYETVRELASLCNVGYQRGDSTDEVARRLLTSLDANKGVIEKLISFLTDKGFRGVVADHDLADVADLHRILSQAPRDPRTSSNRLTLDYHDAVNLAVALKSVRSRKDVYNSSDASCILVTQTRAVLDLLRTVSDLDDKYASDLSRVIGFDGPLVESLYPVLSPRRAFIVEELRNKYGLGDDVFERIKTTRHVYDELSGILARSTRQSSSLLKIQNEPRLAVCLQHLLTLYHGDDPLFRDLEIDRAVDASILYLESKHHLSGEQTEKTQKRGAAYTDLTEEVQSYFKILRDLHLSINELSPTTYKLKIELDETETLQEVTVFSENPASILIEGEIYFADSEMNGIGLPEAYSLRWETACTERQFFAALGAIINVRGNWKRRPPFRLSPLKGDGPEWQEGLVVFTTEGTFGVPLAEISFKWAFRFLSIEEIVRAIRTSSALAVNVRAIL